MPAAIDSYRERTLDRRLGSLHLRIPRERQAQRPQPTDYLADVLTRIADHPARCIADLLPWNGNPLRPPAPLLKPAPSSSAYAVSAIYSDLGQRLSNPECSLLTGTSS